MDRKNFIKGSLLTAGIASLGAWATQLIGTDNKVAENTNVVYNHLPTRR